MDLTPEKASRLVDDGEEEVSLDQVQIGDRLRVRPGQRVPVDGHIIEGSGAIDESMLSGESIPVEKTAGDSVAAGTLSATGSFVMEVNKVGSEIHVAVDSRYAGALA